MSTSKHSSGHPKTNKTRCDMKLKYSTVQMAFVHLYVSLFTKNKHFDEYIKAGHSPELLVSEWNEQLDATKELYELLSPEDKSKYDLTQFNFNQYLN